MDQQFSGLVVFDVLEVLNLFFAFWARAKWVRSYLTDGADPFSFEIFSFKALVAANVRPRYLILTLRTFQRHKVASAAQVMLKIVSCFKIRVVAALMRALKTQKTLVGMGLVFHVL